MDNRTIDIFAGLNSAQNDAVRQTEGASLIIAGAGSGKTRVLTCRIANLISKGVAPWKILALTFTKKAANEMKERIAAMVGEDKARWIWMGTFHSVFIRFLRQYAELLGYPPQFTIYDQDDSRSVVRQCIKELQLDDKTYKPTSIHSRISLAKNNLYTPAAYAADPHLTEEDRRFSIGRFSEIFAMYNAKCRKAGAMDFDDLLLNTCILLRDHPEVLQEIRERFNYILVDEYQDTNVVQYRIIRQLSQQHRNICVVGDDSQSIYKFRGAEIRNILNFRRDYPESTIFRLEQNYRSTQNIVNAANSIISKNRNKLEKRCFSMAENGERIKLITAESDREEAASIAAGIKSRIYSDRASYDQFAILYRTNAQSRLLEEALKYSRIPYRILSGQSFYDRAEVKDIMAYFRLVVNPKDDEAFRRIINLPARGIGDTSISCLAAAAGKAEKSLFDTIFLSNEELLSAGLKGAAIEKLRRFAAMIEPLMAKSRESDADDIADEIGKSTGIVLHFASDQSIDGKRRLENVEQVFNDVHTFCSDIREEIENLEAEAENGQPLPGMTLVDYLENITLLSDAERGENLDEEEDPDHPNKVSLMTVHSAKGLEFPYVFIAGMEKDLFPSSMDQSPDGIEEERRLFYVAVTRAEKAVTLSWARIRMKWGKSEFCELSSFVREIDKQYIEGLPNDYSEMLRTPTRIDAPRQGSSQQNRYGERRSYQQTRYGSGAAVARQRPEQSAPRPTVKPATSQSAPPPRPDFTPSPVSDLKVGQRIEHDRFGYGVILSFEGDGAGTKAMVKFDNGGVKTLLLKFAKLRIV